MKSQYLLLLAVMTTTSAVAQTPAGPEIGGRDSWVDVRGFAVSGSGSRADPWVDALRRALEVYGDGHVYHLPGGYYRDESTLIIRNANLRIIGDGGFPAITTVLYEKTDGTSCWKFESPRGKYLAAIEVSDIRFLGDMKATGAALEIESIRGGLFEGIHIVRFQGDQTTFNNKGVWLKGWDAITFRRLRCYRVTKCVFIDISPNHPTIDADHFHFEDMVLVPGDKAHGVGIEIVADHVTNLIIDGTNTIAVANKGIYFHNASKASLGLNFTLQNVRIEQGGYGADGWGVYIDHKDTLRQLVARNVRVSSGYHGFYLRGCAYTTMQNCFVMGGAYSGVHGDRDSGYMAYDIDSRGSSPLVMINCGHMRWNEKSQVRIADELVLEAGEGMRVYQDGGLLLLKGRPRDPSP